MRLEVRKGGETYVMQHAVVCEPPSKLISKEEIRRLADTIFVLATFPGVMRRSILVENYAARGTEQVDGGAASP